MKAEIISVGTELLLGSVINTDAADISKMLSELGIDVYFHTVVGDNPERARLAIETAKKRADVIITTGGLGPTCDDLTKDVLAYAFGKKLIYNEEAAENIRRYFADRHPGVCITENNYRQAYLPEGCIPFQNACGTAPGCAFEAEGKRVIMLPGPPKECRDMFRLSAVPYLAGLSGERLYSRFIRVFGMGESKMDSLLRPLMDRLTNPTLAPYAAEAECMLRLTAKAESEAEAKRLMAPVLAEVRNTLGDYIYTDTYSSLEETVLNLLREQGKTLAAAESCTGGLFSKRITDLAGASSVFRGAAVTYATETKADILGVDRELLNEKGPVSSDVAAQMAMGARARFGADLGVGITGVAGPASDDFGNPVGTVFAALSISSGVFVRELRLGSDRSRTRTAAASHAFDMIRRYLTGKPIA